MATFYIKENDSNPPLQVKCKRGGVSPEFDSVNDTVVFSMRDIDDGAVKVSRQSAAIVDAETLEFTFSPSHTDVPGVFEGEFEVTLQSGAVETYPNNEYITVRVVDDIA